jgi:GTP cyclohydrolase II
MNAYSSTSHPIAKVIAALAPSRREQVMRIRGDLRMGTPVVLLLDDEAALVVAVEMLTDERHSALCELNDPGQLALSRHRVRGIGQDTLPDADVLCLALPAGAALSDLLAIADPMAQAAHRIDLSGGALQVGNAIHQAAVALAKSAQILPAALILPISDGRAEAARHGLCVAEARDVLHELAAEVLQRPVSSASLPMAVSQSGRVHVYRPDDGSIEHYAIEIGTPDLSRPVLVRLHSACFTGDVLGSLKCDCGPQLQAACVRWPKRAAVFWFI